jgi:hypothetical protein
MDTILSGIEFAIGLVAGLTQQATVLTKTIALSALILLGTIGAAAQAPTQEQIQRAQASRDRFFDSKENQTLSRCSDEAWTIIRQQEQLRLLGKNAPRVESTEVLRTQSTVDACRDQAAKSYDDVWNTLATLLHGELSNDDTPFVREQLAYLEKLRQVQEFAANASEKVLSDYLFDANEQLQSKFDRLANRYNALVDQLATVPLPSSYQRPARLHCETTSNHLGEWSTITTDCQ